MVSLHYVERNFTDTPEVGLGRALASQSGERLDRNAGRVTSASRGCPLSGIYARWGGVRLVSAGRGKYLSQDLDFRIFL